MICLSDATLSTSLKHQQHIGVGYEFQANTSLLKEGLPSQSRGGVKVHGMESVVFWAGRPEDFKGVAQQQHIGFEIEIW